MQAKVNRDVYRKAHGKNPRGYGLWVFDLHRTMGGYHTITHTGNFGDALNVARSQSKDHGHIREIVVQS